MALKEQRRVAEEFAKANLQQCCTELLAWHATGKLPQGRMRELVRLCAFARNDAFAVAENIVKSAAIEEIAARDKGP
jgi:molybdopterin synthase catalytic subunit